MNNKLPESVISSRTPLKNDVNCCNLVEARGEPRTNGDDLSKGMSENMKTFIKMATVKLKLCLTAKIYLPIDSLANEQTLGKNSLTDNNMY